MKPLVYIVVLNWNGHIETLECVESLNQQTYRNFRIILVDNGSTDDSFGALRHLGDSVDLVRRPENLGYAGGNNLAMRMAFDRGAHYVWLFNSDAVAEPDALCRIITACESNHNIGLASPLILEEGGRVQFAGRTFNLTVPDIDSTCDIEQARDWQNHKADRIALTGTAMLVSRQLYESIGGLDAMLFAYWEDTDYSIRSAMAGFQNIVVFDAKVFHPGKPTIAAPDNVRPHYYYFMARNEILLWRKCCPWFRSLKSTIWALRRQLLQIERMSDYPAGIDALLAGLWDGCLGIGGRYDRNRRMPSPLRQSVARHPRFWIRLIDRAK
jgi:GT2 family glycosyltransferase